MLKWCCYCSSPSCGGQLPARPPLLTLSLSFSLPCHRGPTARLLLPIPGLQQSSARTTRNWYSRLVNIRTVDLSSLKNRNEAFLGQSATFVVEGGAAVVCSAPGGQSRPSVAAAAIQDNWIVLPKAVISDWITRSIRTAASAAPALNSSI